jgi:predicted amidophosphoribosyltransferase
VSLVTELVRVLLPPLCVGCGRQGEFACVSCRAGFRPPRNAPPPPFVDWWTACVSYEGVARELIARAKYRHARAALSVFTDELVARLRDAPTPINIVTWAPASASRFAHTGVDHAAVIARELAHALDAPIRPLLRRDRGAPQTGRSAHERRSGPQLQAHAALTGQVVLVVDDVATTGGTLTAAARALRYRGAKQVYAGTLARTPGPGGAVPVRAYTSATTPS